MSWGEKSCKLYGKCSEATEETCNKNCEIYSTGLESDTELEEIAETAQKETPEIVLIHSTAPKFDKKYEFVVLKKHIFYMQDISPKKIILKFKKKLKPTDSLQD